MPERFGNGLGLIGVEIDGWTMERLETYFCSLQYERSGQ